MELQTPTPGEARSGLSYSIWRPLANTLAAAMTLLSIGWAMSFQRVLGIDLYPQQYFAGVLFFVLPIAYLTLPARRATTRITVPWYDVALALISAVVLGYIVAVYPQIVLKIFARTIDVWLPGLLLLLLVLEALRRATGWALVLIISCFCLYGLFGDVFPGRMQGRAQSWDLLVGYLAVDSNGILGLPMSIASTVVMAFIFFGVLLGLTGGSKFFTDAAMIGMGRYRGGSMKIAVFASGLFGSISGSAVANVAGTGVVTIPMIKRDGYPAHKAAAIEAVASTGGQLMPPVMGASAFLMAEFLAIPYQQIVMAALLPAILYYAALFIQADLEAAKLKIKAVPKSQIPAGRLVATGMHFALAFALLIYLLFWARFQPERAALWASGALILSAYFFGYRGEKPSARLILSSLAKTGHSVVEILLISAASGIVIGILNITGLSFNLTYALVQVGGDNIFLLLGLSALVCIILGMGLPTLGVYVLLAALVAPALIEVGINPIAAHLYVLYFGMMSMITPPIAMAAFAAASIAKAPSMATGWAAMRFGWSAYIIPILFVFSPSLILIGEPGQIALAIVTAFIGIWLISCAISGYFSAALQPLTRVLFALSGMMCLIPQEAFSGGLYTDLFGIALGGGLMFFEYKKAKTVVAGDEDQAT
jgi:TRAP transporter 4TM/12TM fusion protein